MSGCGTSLKGRAIVEIYENGMSVHDYDYWVKNYISVQQGVAEGRITPEQADWTEMTIYIKEADSQELYRVELKRTDNEDGTIRISWLGLYEDGDDYQYLGDDRQVLAFEFDPYEGLDRYTLTIVPRESADDPMPEGWNGWFIFDGDCPFWGRQQPEDMWKWVDSHTIEVGVSGDVLVTPYGEEPGVTDPIATREIAVRKPS
jgi:hypothetical protein